MFRNKRWFLYLLAVVFYLFSFSPAFSSLSSDNEAVGNFVKALERIRSSVNEADVSKRERLKREGQKEAVDALIEMVINEFSMDEILRVIGNSVVPYMKNKNNNIDEVLFFAVTLERVALDARGDEEKFLFDLYWLYDFPGRGVDITLQNYLKERDARFKLYMQQLDTSLRSFAAIVRAGSNGGLEDFKERLGRSRYDVVKAFRSAFLSEPSSGDELRNKIKEVLGEIEDSEVASLKGELIASLNLYRGRDLGEWNIQVSKLLSAELKSAESTDGGDYRAVTVMRTSLKMYLDEIDKKAKGVEEADVVKRRRIFLYSLQRAVVEGEDIFNLSREVVQELLDHFSETGVLRAGAVNLIVGILNLFDKGMEIPRKAEAVGFLWSGLRRLSDGGEKTLISYSRWKELKRKFFKDTYLSFPSDDERDDFLRTLDISVFGGIVENMKLGRKRNKKITSLRDVRELRNFEFTLRGYFAILRPGVAWSSDVAPVKDLLLKRIRRAVERAGPEAVDETVRKVFADYIELFKVSDKEVNPEVSNFSIQLRRILAAGSKEKIFSLLEDVKTWEPSRPMIIGLTPENRIRLMSSVKDAFMVCFKAMDQRTSRGEDKVVLKREAVARAIDAIERGLTPQDVAKLLTQAFDLYDMYADPGDPSGLANAFFKRMQDILLKSGAEKENVLAGLRTFLGVDRPYVGQLSNRPLLAEDFDILSAEEWLVRSIEAFNGRALKILRASVGEGPAKGSILEYDIAKYRVILAVEAAVSDGVPVDRIVKIIRLVGKDGFSHMTRSSGLVVRRFSNKVESPLGFYSDLTDGILTGDSGGRSIYEAAAVRVFDVVSSAKEGYGAFVKGLLVDAVNVVWDALVHEKDLRESIKSLGIAVEYAFSRGFSGGEIMTIIDESVPDISVFSGTKHALLLKAVDKRNEEAAEYFNSLYGILSSGDYISGVEGKFLIEIRRITNEFVLEGNLDKVQNYSIEELIEKATGLMVPRGLSSGGALRLFLRNSTDGRLSDEQRRFSENIARALVASVLAEREELYEKIENLSKVEKFSVTLPWDLMDTRDSFSEAFKKSLERMKIKDMDKLFNEWRERVLK